MTPDGASIEFSSAAAGPLNLYRKSSIGAGNPDRLTNSPLTQFAVDWSGDGRFLMYVEIGQETGFDLMVLPMSAGEKPFVFLQTKFQDTQGRFSPNAPRWIAYASDESGVLEIYVQAFTPGQPATGAKRQVSSGGGREPHWRGDGKELYYLSPGREGNGGECEDGWRGLPVLRPEGVVPFSHPGARVHLWDVSRHARWPAIPVRRARPPRPNPSL